MTSRQQFLPPGAASAAPDATLMAELAGLDPARLSGPDTVATMAAWERLSRHADAQVLRLAVEAGRARARAGLERADEPDAFSADEMRVPLTISRKAARRRHGTAEALVHRLPTVWAAMSAGLLDEERGRAFVETLAPLPDDLARLVCARVLPAAPGLVLDALQARLDEEAAALDPGWAARWERTARRARRVRAWRHRSGTAGLAGYDLPMDRVAGGVARLEAIAAAARRRGAQAGSDALCADAYLGLVDGLFAGLDDEEIVETLVAAHSPGLDGVLDDDGRDDGPDDEGPDGEGPDGEGPDDEGPDDEGPDDEGPDGGGPDGGGPDGDDPDGDDPDGDDRDEDGGSDSGDAPEPARTTRTMRGTVEVRGRLSTVLGLDDLPGEIAGLGALTPTALRGMVAARTAGQWRLVVTDPGGYLEFVDLLRRRPSGRRRGGPGDVVELAVPAALLQDLDPDVPELVDELPPGAEDWFPVLREALDRHRGWCAAGRPLPEEPDPRVRMPRAVLARWTRARDRHCRGPGCTRTAHSVELDHTVDHARDGPTAWENLSGGCRHDHRLKTVGGWTLEQPRPGRLRWTTRAGASHETEPTPVIRDLPEPRPRRSGPLRPVPPPRVELLRGDEGPTGAGPALWSRGTSPSTGSSGGHYPEDPPF